MIVWQLIAWIGVIVCLGWVTFPLSFQIFNRLPDRGYALSRILGLLVWSFLFWFLGSLGVLQNHPGGILFALAILITLNLWAGWRQWGAIRAWVQNHWRLILITELVFLVGFLFLALVRVADPAATGTEKPMELAFINAILNSETFPPHDPWLSGYAISYYHFGYIMAAMLAKLTSTSGAAAFNLMLSAIFAMSAVGAYGVLYNLLETFEERLKGRFNNLAWALFGPVFLLFVSNLEAILEICHQRGVGWDLHAGTSRFWDWVNLESLRTPPLPPLSLIPQRFWWWWQASRVIQDIDLLGNVSGLSPIDEFPAFSFVLGDLHPHVLVIPFVMLLVGLAFNIFLGGMEDDKRVSGCKFPYRWDLFLVSAITLGGIAFLNTWDLPVYFALLTGSFFLQQVRQKGWHWERLWDLLTLAVPLGVVAASLYAPFFISFQSQAGGILPNLIYPTRGLYLWLMFGALFVPLFLFFIRLHRKGIRADWRQGGALIALLILVLFLFSIGLGYRGAQTEIGRSMIQAQGESTFGGLIRSAIAHRLAYGISLLTLAGLLVSGLAYLLGLTRKTPEGANDHTSFAFVTLMIVLGGVMVLAPEFVYLGDHFGTRMNTIFKFYYQAWMLWSLSAAFATVVILKQGAWFSKGLVILMVLLGLVYPGLAYPARTNQFRMPSDVTLDADAYLAKNQPDEAAAIEWLAQAEPGVVAEAVGGQYSGYARVATLSGKPTVLGWPGHESQWRGGYTEVANREPDLRTLYETFSWESALEIIRRYDIRYIYVGSLEMATYALNPVKFEAHLQVGFEQGGVKVYVVPQTLIY